MRILLKVNIPVEDGNRLAKKGKLGEAIQTILAELKPEAVYFTAENGERTALIFLQVQDSSEIPKLAEPWFLMFNASVEMYPVMALEDLVKAAPDIEKAAKKYA